MIAVNAVSAASRKEPGRTIQHDRNLRGPESGPAKIGFLVILVCICVTRVPDVEIVQYDPCQMRSVQRVQSAPKHCSCRVSGTHDNYNLIGNSPQDEAV